MLTSVILYLFARSQDNSSESSPMRKNSIGDIPAGAMISNEGVR